MVHLSISRYYSDPIPTLDWSFHHVTLKISIFVSSTASVLSLSSPLGSFISGPIMDQFGRKPGLIISTVPLVLGWILIALAASRPVLLAGRVLTGIAVGLMGAPAQVRNTNHLARTLTPRLNFTRFTTLNIELECILTNLTIISSVFHRYKLAQRPCSSIENAFLIILHPNERNCLSR